MPDTWGPYRAAYIIVAVAYTAYAVSIWWRARKVRERLAERKGTGARG